MKRFNHLNALVYFIITMLLAPTVRGQEAMLVPLSRVPSPQATDLGRFGDIPMSYYTGRANVTVPICSFNERGVTLDINLSYDTSGLLMNKLPSWVGPGWTLNAGGCITRVQRYLCDETTPWDLPSNLVRYFDAYNEVAPNGVLDSTTVLDIDNWGHKDYAPDIFYFNFMGKTGRFFFGNDGKWKVSSEDNLVVEFDVSNQSNYMLPVFTHFPNSSDSQPKTIKGFVIYDDQGNKYTFGGDTSAIEYSLGFFKTWTGYRDEPWKADCWYLKSVEDRFGNQLYTFNYKRGKYCLQIFNTGKQSQPYTGTLNLPVYLTDISTLSDHHVIFASSSPYQAGQVARHLYPSLYPNSTPAQIFPNGVSMNQPPWYYLLKKDEDTGPYFATPTANYNDPLSAIDIERLTSIITWKGQLTSPVTYHLNYSDTGRYHLTDIQIKSDFDIIGTYTFTYNDFQSIDEDYLTKKHDSGGYFNNTIYSLSPDSTYAKKGMMTKITYPTGGYSVLDYELNDFSCAMDTTRQYVVEGLGQAYGLRICSITEYLDENGSAAKRRIIKYKNPSTGISSGQYFMDPDDDQYYTIWRSAWNTGNSTPMIPLCTSLKTFVGYSVVTDSVIGGSSHIYCYNNFRNDGWAPPTGTAPGVNNTDLGNFNDYFRRDFMRGKIATEYISDNNQAIYKKIRYEYRTDSTTFLNQKSFGFDPVYHIHEQGGVYTLYYPKYDLQRIATSTKYDNGWVNDTITYVMTDFNSSIGTLPPPYFRKLSEERTERAGEKTQKLYGYQSSTSTKYFIPLVSTISKCNNSKVITEKCLYESFGGVKHPKYETRAVGIGGQDTLITYHSYSSTGLPTSYTRDGEYPTHLFWDSQGRLLASLTCPPALASQAVLDTTAVDPIHVLRIGSQSIFNYPEVRATSYVYDAHGNIAATATENGLTHYYLYDVFGRLTEIQDRQHRTLQRFDYHYSTSSQNNNPDIPTI